MRKRDYAWVGMGGMLGASARLVVSGMLDGTYLPWGILTANLIGTALLVAVSIISHRLAPEHRAALGTGFCGAFTTVSSLSAEIAAHVQEGRWERGLLYFALTLLTALPMAIWLLRWHPPEEGVAK